MTEQPRFQPPLRNPNLSTEADRAVDRLMDAAGIPPGQAMRIVADAAKTRRGPEAAGDEVLEARQARIYLKLNTTNIHNATSTRRSKVALQEAERRAALDAQLPGLLSGK